MIDDQGQVVGQNPYPTDASHAGGQAYPNPAPYGQPSPYTAYQQSYPQTPVAPEQPMFQQSMQQPVQQSYQPMNTYPYQVEGQPSDPARVPEKVKPPRKELDMEKIIRPFVIFGLPVMMVLFLLCMVLGNILWLKWVFLGFSLCLLGVMWLNRAMFQRDMVLTFSVVLVALAVVASVSVLTTPVQVTGYSGTPVPGPVEQLQVGLGGSVSTQSPVEETPAAWVQITPQPATAKDSGLQSVAVERMLSFLHFWSANAHDSMVELCLPSWVKSVKEPNMALFSILGGRTPLDYTPTAISGTDNDITRTVTTNMTVERNGAVNKYIFKIVMTREDDVWYIDPRSLESNVKATATPASAEITQPPTPAPVADPSVVLYYNPDGGTMYHLDANCKSTHSKFLPFKGMFTYGQLNEPAYVNLIPCSICAAPLRPAAH